MEAAVLLLEPEMPASEPVPVAVTETPPGSSNAVTAVPAPSAMSEPPVTSMARA